MRSLKTRIQSFGGAFSGPLLISLLARVANRRPADFSFGTAQRLLVLKLDEIGDFIMSTAFLRELRRNAPRAEIVLVVKPAIFNLAETCPYVNRVLIFDWDASRHLFPVLGRQWRGLRLAMTRLRRRHFDVAFIPRWDADTYHATQLAVYAGARAIVAYSEKCTAIKRVVNRGYDRLVSCVIPPTADSGHETERSLAMIERCGGVVASSALEIWPTEDDRSFARANLAEGWVYVAMATGASKSIKCWPRERFGELAVWLTEKYRLKVVLFGLKTDPALENVASFLGQTTLRQAAAMFARCVLYIGNDSGLKHIAAAVKTPVIEISPFRRGGAPNHPNSPVRFRARDVNQRVVQPPPGVGECAIEEVTLDAVKTAVEEMLGELSIPKKVAIS